MSNRVTLQVTKFVNLDSNMRESEPSFGYRLYDDYEAVYNNCVAKEELPRTPEEALAVIKEHESFYVDGVLQKGGFFFNDDWYQVDEDGKIAEEAVV